MIRFEFAAEVFLGTERQRPEPRTRGMRYLRDRAHTPLMRFQREAGFAPPAPDFHRQRQRGRGWRDIAPIEPTLCRHDCGVLRRPMRVRPTFQFQIMRTVTRAADVPMDMQQANAPPSRGEGLGGEPEDIASMHYPPHGSRRCHLCSGYQVGAPRRAALHREGNRRFPP